MIKLSVPGLLLFVSSMLVTGASHAQSVNENSVTQEMLLNPDPADWLLFNRTYDNHRFSPLDEVNKNNVDQLKMAWSRGMSSRYTGNHSSGASRCHVYHSSCL